VVTTEQNVILEVWDAGSISDTIIGSADVKLATLLSSSTTHEVEIFFKKKSAGKLFLKSVWNVDD